MTFDNTSSLPARTLIPIYIISFTILLVLLSSVVIISFNYDIPIEHFTRDPAAVFNGHPYVGLLSNIGILLWCFTSSICFFSSAILCNKKNKEISKFLLCSGLLTFFLLVDDLFMFHDSIFPLYLRIPEKAVYLGYLILFTIYFVKFRLFTFKTEHITLYLACSFFALSLGCDLLLPNEGIQYLAEDGFKLFGITAWFIFFIRTCFTQVKLAIHSQQCNESDGEVTCQQI